MTVAAPSPTHAARAASCAASPTCWSRGHGLLLAAAAGAAAAVARRRLSRLAVRAPGAELLLDRRVLRHDRPRADAQDLSANSLQPANLDIILRTAARRGHRHACSAALIAFPIAYYAARYATRPHQGAVLPRGDDAAVVELPRQGLCLEAAARQGRRHRLGRCRRSARAAVLDAWLAMPVIGGPSLSVSYTGMVLVFLYLWMPFMVLPIQAALERVPASLIEASGDLGASPRADLPHGDPAARLARRRRGLDLHLLADPRRLHRAADRRAVLADPRPGRLRAAGHRRQHPARRRLLGGADRRDGRSSSRSPSGWGRSMRCERGRARIEACTPRSSPGGDP